MTTWIATTQDDKLADRTSDIESTNATTAADLQLDGNEYQALRGFGGCFNELGWLPLQNVSEAERDQIIKELFSPDEMNFTFNRAPVGANDFADHWYSYDEVDGDYGMEHFSVEHDEQTLIPYIHRAQEWQPNMQLFSSPWSPPTWMKRPKAYNYGRLVQTPENLKAYAKYFVKYIQAYAEHGITVNQLHVQNEVFADQKFPSALWDSEALKVFIRDYLGPAFDEAGLDTDIWLGTLNGPEDMAWTGGGYGMTLNNYNRFVDNILFDDGARKYIKGIAYQWAGQNCHGSGHGVIHLQGLFGLQRSLAGFHRVDDILFDLGHLLGGQSALQQVDTGRAHQRALALTDELDALGSRSCALVELAGQILHGEGHALGSGQLCVGVIHRRLAEHGADALVEQCLVDAFYIVAVQQTQTGQVLDAQQAGEFVFQTVCLDIKAGLFFHINTIDHWVGSPL